MIQYKEVELSVKMVIPVDEDPYGLDLEGIQDKACALEIGVERENPVTIDIALGKITDYAGELHTHCLSDDEIKALQEQPRIIGDFEKQHTDNSDYIVEGETVQFDATAYILTMGYESMMHIEDCSDSSDRIGITHVSHDGPYSVYITAGITQFFSVDYMDDITPEMYAKAQQTFMIDQDS